MCCVTNLPCEHDRSTGKNFENPQKAIEWKLYGPLLEIEWILVIHNNCILPCYGYSFEIVWIYCGFSDAIAWYGFHIFSSDHHRFFTTRLFARMSTAFVSDRFCFVYFRSCMF
jgi:hypothetical protein